MRQAWLTAITVPAPSNTATCADKLSRVERSSASISTPCATSIGTDGAFRCPRRLWRSEAGFLVPVFAARCISASPDHGGCVRRQCLPQAPGLLLQRLRRRDQGYPDLNMGDGPSSADPTGLLRRYAGKLHPQATETIYESAKHRHASSRYCWRPELGPHGAVPD